MKMIKDAVRRRVGKRGDRKTEKNLNEKGKNWTIEGEKRWIIKKKKIKKEEK